MPLQDPDQLILETRRLVESNKRLEIRLNANGGNSILVVCNPSDELSFIESMKRNLPSDSFSIIDLNKVLNRFLEQNKDHLDDLFELLQGSVQQIFKAPNGENRIDLFKMILDAIKDCFTQGKTPVLINSGTLYGTGIDNIHIMEHEIVMKGSLPIIILYPATKEADRLLFLGKRPASKYRCLIVS